MPNPPSTTPTQLVAENLRRARELRGWTQEHAAKELEPYLGARWSKTTFSNAERSVAGERVRQFTPDDLLAFSLGFRLPIVWFLMPADASTRVATPDGDRPAGLLLDQLFRRTPELVARLEELVLHLPQDGLGTRAQVDLRQRAERYYANQVVRAVGDRGPSMARVLRWLADTIERAMPPELEVVEELLREEEKR
jgi:transcriptional regulator with XRE-family HTH domain